MSRRTFDTENMYKFIADCYQCKCPIRSHTVIYGRFFSIFSLEAPQSNMAGPELSTVPGMVT